MADFGVQTANPFDLLDEDAPKKKKEAKQAPAEPEKKKEASRRPQSARTGDRPATEKGERSEKGERGGKGEGRGRGDGKGRGRGKGGKGKGEGGAPREPREGKREFDRHESGNNRTRDAKKGGSGKYNWGTPGSEGAEGEGRRERRPPRKTDVPAAEAEVEVKAEEAPVEEVAAEAAVEIEEIDEGPPVFTYEEFLAKKAGVEEDQQIKIRTVQNDDSAFKGGKALEKVEDVNEYAAALAKKGTESKVKAKSAKTAKVSLDQFAKEAPGSSRGGGKGGKGGKGRGRGADRGDNRPFTMKDYQFPTLGGK